jgi:hypothetical protein
MRDRAEVRGSSAAHPSQLDAPQGVRSNRFQTGSSVPTFAALTDSEPCALGMTETRHRRFPERSGGCGGRPVAVEVPTENTPQKTARPGSNIPLRSL